MIQLPTTPPSASGHQRTPRVALGLLLVWLLGGGLAVRPSAAQAPQTLAPPPALTVRGVPPVPTSLAQALAPYQDGYGLPLAGWHPTRHELWLKGLSSVAWVSRTTGPGKTPEVTPAYIAEPGIYDVYPQPQGRYLAYTRDTQGNEAFQLYLYDVARRTSRLLSDGASRNTEPLWAPAGTQLAYSWSPTGSDGVGLRLNRPFAPESDRLLAAPAGSYLKAAAWSPDEKSLVVVEYLSNTTSHLWLWELATGTKTRLSPATPAPDFYDSPQFTPDGTGLYLLTDHAADVRRVAYLDLTTRRWTYPLPPSPSWEVESFQLAPDGQTLAWVVNENGFSRLHLWDVAQQREKPMAAVPEGLISDLHWHADGSALAFNFTNPQTPHAVYVLVSKTGQAEPWVKSAVTGWDTEQSARSSAIRWQSFDGVTLHGYLARPPARFTGPRPVIIDLHGGPEEQYRPAFGYEDNYYLNELGVAKIYPNVRGSAGYGKKFLRLDNGMLRENAVRDVGALLDWVKTQPDLDARRVLVQGSSYGGYLALAVAAAYGPRLRGVVAESAITNLATFVARTEGWRRALQRAEFGDERDPQVRAWMTRTAPVQQAARCSTPLFLTHGQNDPRVPVSEADAFVTALAGRVPVWYLRAEDEGHGFAQPLNRNFRSLAQILFVQQYLLP